MLDAGPPLATSGLDLRQYLVANGVAMYFARYQIKV